MQASRIHLKFIGFVFLFLSFPASATLTRLVVESTEKLDSGEYEAVSGSAYGELDPGNPLNSIITDLEFAPTNASGQVEYVSTFTILKPIDMSDASGVMFYLAPNRGRENLTGFDVLSRAGHVMVNSGWQADLPGAEGRESLQVPIAKYPDGSSITGPVLARFSDMPAGTTTLPIRRGGVTGTADPVTLDTSQATLTRRTSEEGMLVPLHSSEWAFADCSDTRFPGKPDQESICIRDGFDPQYLYELVYTAKDPRVMGIGFAAVRDLNSYLRYESADVSGTANLLENRITSVISQGHSQAGTFLRSFVHLGFNQDIEGRIVFDGMNPNIAFRLLAMNIRFAAPSGSTGMYEPGSEGVVWWGEYTDNVRGRTPTSLLDRCRVTETCPKIVETFGSAEFYHLRASPALLGTRADQDIPLPSNVRRYYFPGVRHGGGPGGFDQVAQVDPCCELAQNPNSSRESTMAIIVALVDWVVHDTLPPPSQYPRLDRGELALPTQASLGFPIIPGIPLPDGITKPLYDNYFGPEFDYRDLSGVISIQPPPIRQILPMLMPKVDSDGNEISGVASPLHQVPLGTYTGWNINSTGFYKDRIRTNAGSFIPFKSTRAERLAAGDPRPSLEERYGSHDNYVQKVKLAVSRLLRARYLLQEDAERLVAEAEASNVLR